MEVLKQGGIVSGTSDRSEVEQKPGVLVSHISAPITRVHFLLLSQAAMSFPSYTT